VTVINAITTTAPKTGGPTRSGTMSDDCDTEIQRFKDMYINGEITLEVLEAVIEYYHEEIGSGPTTLGMSIPSSVDPDAPSSDPAEHPGVQERLND
jgi:hypothetical protein